MAGDVEEGGTIAIDVEADQLTIPFRGRDATDGDGEAPAEADTAGAAT